MMRTSTGIMYLQGLRLRKDFSGLPEFLFLNAILADRNKGSGSNPLIISCRDAMRGVSAIFFNRFDPLPIIEESIDLFLSKTHFSRYEALPHGLWTAEPS